MIQSVSSLPVLSGSNHITDTEEHQKYSNNSKNECNSLCFLSLRVNLENISISASGPNRLSKVCVCLDESDIFDDKVCQP